MSDKELLIPASQIDASAINARTRRGRLQMLFLLLACASPVIASYLAYYVFKPEGAKTNFGTLVQPVQELNSAWFDSWSCRTPSMFDAIERNFSSWSFANAFCGKRKRAVDRSSRQSASKTGRE